MSLLLYWFLSSCYSHFHLLFHRNGGSFKKKSGRVLMLQRDSCFFFCSFICCCLNHTNGYVYRLCLLCLANCKLFWIKLDAYQVFPSGMVCVPIWIVNVIRSLTWPCRSQARPLPPLDPTWGVYWTLQEASTHVWKCLLRCTVKETARTCSREYLRRRLSSIVVIPFNRNVIVPSVWPRQRSRRKWTKQKADCSVDLCQWLIVRRDF